MGSIGRRVRSNSSPELGLQLRICMLIAVGATCSRSAAAAALPASTTSQK